VVSIALDSATMSITANLQTKLPVILALLLCCQVSALADLACPAGPPAPALHLRHLRAALEHGAEAVVVALGSSSTQGAMASDPAHSYPAALQAALEHALPRMHIAVLNRGIGGQDAAEELARMQADAIAARPQLVIWQVGANGALLNADPAEFRRMVMQGVARLQEVGIDVILMDNQRSPRMDAAPEHAVLNKVLAQVAETAGIGLFSRADLMAAWNEGGALPLAFIAADGLHHNDRGYVCVADALADAILHGLRETRALAASR
jgi:lysophospholipase L1-like esterase